MPVVTHKGLLALLAIGIGGYITLFPFDKYDDVWGNHPDEPYITVKGKKPTDATVSAWVTLGAGGDECESYSYDMFGRRAFKGGKIDQKITQDFSTDPNYYELRFPYKTHRDSNNCVVELRDFSLSFKNDFSGFATLNIYEPMYGIDENVPSLDTLFEAKECNAGTGQNALKKWLGWIDCNYYSNGKFRHGMHPEDIELDFTKFTDETVIHYDVYAGEHYRSEPLDPVLG